MGESKHTAGPWVADVDYVHGPIVTAANGDIVADYTMWDGHRDEASANARLIAACPDFYAAAQSLLQAWDARTATVAEQIVTGKSDRDLQKQAAAALEGLRAAIAKATGATS